MAQKGTRKKNRFFILIGISKMSCGIKCGLSCDIATCDIDKRTIKQITAYSKRTREKMCTRVPNITNLYNITILLSLYIFIPI